MHTHPQAIAKNQANHTQLFDRDVADANLAGGHCAQADVGANFGRVG